MEEVVEKIAVATADEADGVIRALIKDCVDGVSDREAEALALALKWGAQESRVKEGFARAREALARTKLLAKTKAKEPELFISPALPPGVARPATGVVEAKREVAPKPAKKPWLAPPGKALVKVAPEAKPKADEEREEPKAGGH